MSPTLLEILGPFRQRVMITWFGLFAAVPSYVVVGTMIVQGNPNRPDPDSTLSIAFAATSVLLALGSLLVPRLYPPAAMIASALSGSTDPESLARDPESSKVDEALAGKIRQLDGSERKILLLRPLFQIQVIIRCALAEAVAVLGFVLVMQGHGIRTMLPFAAASLVLLVLAFPRFAPFVERALQAPHA